MTRGRVEIRSAAMSTLSEGAELYLSESPRLVDCGTARIAYRTYGSGDPIMFIHGWPFSGFVYRHQLAALSEHYTCITVDLAGAGESEWDEGNDFSFHGHARHLQKVAESMGLDSYRLVAHDTGATVARRLAILEGDKVIQSVCIDTEIPNHRPPMVGLFMKLSGLPGANYIFRRLLKSRRFVKSKNGFGGCFVNRDLIDGEFYDFFCRRLAESKEAAKGQLLYVRGIDWKQLDELERDHARIEGEVLLIWGDRDPFFPIDRARAMMPQFKNCKGLIEIEGTKLLPFEEKPEVVNDHIMEFFAGD